LVSLVITTAGNACPLNDGAVGPEDRLELADLLVGGSRSGAVVGAHRAAVRQFHGHDLALEEAALDGVLGAVLAADAPVVLVFAADPAQDGDVLGGLTHRDVDVGDVVVFAGIVPILGTLGGGRRALRGFVEQRVLGIGQRVRAALDEPGHRLDAGRDEGVALAGLDRVESHPDGLQRRRTVAVDGGAGQEVVAELDGDHAGHVEALLAAGQAAAQDQVVDLVGVERLDFVECGAHHLRGQVVRPDADQRPFHGAPDGRTGS
jgi:hypothetical protein